jgi:hypothetical protein
MTVIEREYMLLALLILLLAACSREACVRQRTPAPEVKLDPSPTLSSVRPLDRPSPTKESPSASKSAFSVRPEVRVEWAIADLAQRLGVTTGRVEVVQVTSDEFPQPGLGCGKPQGGRAPDVLVSAQVIRLRVGQTAYEYRARGQEIFFCGASSS